mmetsp:Transcript_30578/g.103105  ORF Transcript_30578/g.103105 Transcript_30578/m.103105 type:complete len:215 (+) Transcript_30578:742-1386(+)
MDRTPGCAKTSSASESRRSAAASGKASPPASADVQHQIMPASSSVGSTVSRDRAASQASGAASCGTRAQAPVSPSNAQPWYGHSSRPASSTRPSESRAQRCGHRSVAARKLAPSCHTTTSAPRISTCSGSSRRVVAAKPTGHHRSNHHAWSSCAAVFGASTLLAALPDRASTTPAATAARQSHRIEQACDVDGSVESRTSPAPGVPRITRVITS